MRHLLIVAALLFASSCSHKMSDLTEGFTYVKDSVVKINTPEGGSGTGFYVRNRGQLRIVTNAHVCGTLHTPLKITNKSKHLSYVTHPIYFSVERDLCILETDNSYEGAALPLSKRTLRSGEKTLTAGHPMGNDLTLHEGMYVMTLKIEVGYDASFCDDGMGKLVRSMFGDMCVIAHKSLIHTAATFPGNSGGPLLNIDGEVVGVSYASGEHASSAIPLEDLREALEEI